MEWSFLFFFNSALLGVGLAMDAFSVSMANGLHDPQMSRRRGVQIAGTFAIFQAVMPMTGWVCVHTIVELFSSFEKFIPWIALILLGYIGGKMLIEGIKGEEAEEAAELSAGALFMQGVATSIDALSVGFTISEYGWFMALVCSLIVAIVTFFICEAGLAKPGRRGGVYDAFRNRLMFPVIDVRGNVIAFSGRILGDGEPKYLNSPETPVFSKSHNLFGLNLAKKSKSGYIILVEGNIDVVSLHQAGFDSAVASLGTSLTPEQARLLSRYTGEIVIAYDNDGAGQKASQRAIGILEKLEVRVRVLQMQGAKDPDEYIKTFGADAFRNLLEQSENHIDYRLGAVQRKYDLQIDEQRVAFVKEAAGVVAELPGSVEREVYAMRVAETAGMPAAVVTDEVQRQRKRRLSRARKEREREMLRPATAMQPPGRSIRFDDPRSAAAEQGIIRLLYLDPGLFYGRTNVPDAAQFSSPELRHIYTVLLAHGGTGTVQIAALSGELTSDELALLTGIIQQPAELANGARALDDYISILQTQATAGAASSEADLLAFAKQLKEHKGYGGKDGTERHE